MLCQLRQLTRGMALLVDELLNLSRARTIALKKEQVNLRELAGKIAEDLKRAGPERKVEFHIANLREV